MELTDIEKAKLVTIVSDEVAVEALRKVFLAAIYDNGVLRQGVPSEPLRNAAFALVSKSRMKDLSNEDLGADLKSLWEGVNALESGFNYLEELRDSKSEPKEEVNEAI